MSDAQGVMHRTRAVRLRSRLTRHPSLDGDTPGDEAPEPDFSEPNPNDRDLRLADDDPLPDEQAAEPNSTPQGRALS